MKVLSTPIDNPMDVPRITRFEVANIIEDDESDPKSLSITVRLLGPGAIQYGIVVLTAFDEMPSTRLKKNIAQQGYSDLFQVFGEIVPGAYTTLSAAYNANVANPTKRKRCLAVEDLLPSTLLSAEFA